MCKLHLILNFLVVYSVFVFSASCRCSSYNLPPASAVSVTDENTVELEKISRGLNKIAKQAGKAIVLVSFKKPDENATVNLFDPFQFFFGPDNPFFDVPRGHGNENNMGKLPTPEIVGIGSGFIIDLDKGYILTNNHVVQDAKEINLKLSDGKNYKGKVLGSDPNTDIAVVQISDKSFNKSALASIALGDSDAIRPGNFVLALGAPFGLEASVTFGVVSAIKRGPLDIAKIGNFIQTDAAINPGNSGGPLLNIYGQVIGINTAIYSQSGGYAGIGMAVPSNLARVIAQELINNGKIERGYIGVQIMDLNEEIAKDLGIPEGTSGVLVSNVVKGGPAYKADIEPGDVIISVDGKNVVNSTDLVTTVGLVKPGSSIKLAIFRNGKQRTVNLKVESYSPDKEKMLTNEGNLFFGMILETVNQTLARRFNFESKYGAVVIEIDRRGVAFKAGIRIGDVILSCNGNKIENSKDFDKYANGKNRLLLRVERSRQYFFVIIKQ
ncbi:MAG: Do family serine endopeptidase [Oligoflexales bacterium]|nr:Do family serine endopeptidase [Oligoflexales bacterium]